MSDAPFYDESNTGPLVVEGDIPQWLLPLVNNVAGVSEVVANRGGDRRGLLTNLLTRTRRTASVLVLFAGRGDAMEMPDDTTVLLTERAASLRNHAGQVAFPGGSYDPGDDFPVGTAMREAVEETGIDPAVVCPLATLPSFPVPPSGFDVVPVVGWSSTSPDVRVVDTAETTRVVHVPMSELLDPAHRFRVQRTVLGGRVYRGPAFAVRGMLVWGFTGGLLDAICETAGWSIPWDESDIRDLDAAWEQVRR